MDWATMIRTPSTSLKDFSPTLSTAAPALANGAWEEAILAGILRSSFYLGRAQSQVGGETGARRGRCNP